MLNKWWFRLLVGLVLGFLIGWGVSRWDEPRYVEGASPSGGLLLGGLMAQDGGLVYLTFTEAVGVSATYVYPDGYASLSDLVAESGQDMTPARVLVLACEEHVGVVVEWDDPYAGGRVEHYAWDAPEGTRFPCGGEGSVLFLPVVEQNR